MLQKFTELYKTNAWFRGLVQAVEAGALLSLADLSLDSNDLFTGHGLKHIAIAVGGGIAVAIRNYLVNRPGSPAGPTSNGGNQNAQ